MEHIVTGLSDANRAELAADIEAENAGRRERGQIPRCTHCAEVMAQFATDGDRDRAQHATADDCRAEVASANAAADPRSSDGYYPAMFGDD